MILKKKEKKKAALPYTRCSPTCVKSLIDMSPCPDGEDGDQMPDQRDGGGNLYGSGAAF